MNINFTIEISKWIMDDKNQSWKSSGKKWAASNSWKFAGQ